MAMMWTAKSTRVRCALLLAALGLLRCTRVMFVKDGATTQDFEREKWECDRDLGMLGANASSERTLAYALTSYRADAERCLTMKGWHRAATP